MKKRILMVALFSGTVMMAGAVQAQGHRGGPDFATLDVDGDGSLSQLELQSPREARFAAADTDGDGALSAEEMTAAAVAQAEARTARMLERLDANEDGLLQQEEMRPRGADRADRMFERVDQDGDGVISEAEYDAAKSRMEERRGERRGDHRGPRGRG
ncbi:EF-hand domain-containing protein [Loktanella agnita]|uniref:EF-hand domain-containing protein n=1 Tax=Loktanella agnita TaxID=287097 RepID=UPI003985ACAC